ncbi:hypothetical protein CIP107550_00932 [Corynebacterium diphtheriae]|nr:hypothetical protein CIP107550_00932 [Corynebacterium diphtheriae]
MASQEVGHSTWFRSCIPIISVNERAHGSTGSASITVTITVFCGAVDGIDDGITVRLHGRSLVCMDGLDTLFPTKPRTLVSCATPEPPAS